MKLKEYIEHLQKIAEKRPEALEWNLIYSIDDEGNGYNQINYEPSTCLFEFQDGELLSYEYDENDEEIEVPEEKHNCIIIN